MEHINKRQTKGVSMHANNAVLRIIATVKLLQKYPAGLTISKLVELVQKDGALVSERTMRRTLLNDIPALGCTVNREGNHYILNSGVLF